MTAIFPGPVMWLLYAKVFPRKFISYLKLNIFWIFVPEKYFLMPIFNPLLTTDRHCGIQQVQILLPLVSLHKRALKAAILLKTTTLAISDYNFLSVLPLEERLNYNKGVLVHKIMSADSVVGIAYCYWWHRSCPCDQFIHACLIPCLTSEPLRLFHVCTGVS